jgi:hypothetical protein
MLFKTYDKITYRLGSRDVTLVDIFRSISFYNIETSNAFDDYYIQDGETPEILSTRLYGTSSLSWLIMLVNGYTRIEDDWFVSQQEYLKQKEATYGGDAFYIPALPDLQAGDILVKVTGLTGATGVDRSAAGICAAAFRHISDFDPHFRKIRGICGGGTFASGDRILFARYNPDSGTVVPLYFDDQNAKTSKVNYTDVLYRESYETSVLYLYNSFNVVIDPYRFSISGSTSINSNTIYLNPADTLTQNNFARCVLYRYGICGGTLPTGLFKKTVGEDNYAKYLKKQKIKVLKSEFVGSVVSTIESALQSPNIGKTLKIEL